LLTCLSNKEIYDLLDSGSQAETFHMQTQILK
jgi:hypothetical protein